VLGLEVLEIEERVDTAGGERNARVLFKYGEGTRNAWLPPRRKYEVTK
jgi:hypothetical protein